MYQKEVLLQISWQKNMIFIRAFCKSLYLKQPPFYSSDILPQKVAERDCDAITSLAPFGGKGLRVRGLK
jgi:hypothetical protein